MKAHRSLGLLGTSLALATAIAAAVAGCEAKSPESRPAPAPSASAAPDAATTAPARVVAVGDLHGDLASTREVLRLAGAIDESDAWIGGDLVLVQTGDQIDRGDDDRKILDLFERLRDQAAAAGGKVIAMLGNHEIMNAAFDFRYVTDGAFAEFADVDAPVPPIDGLAATQRGRAAAFAPGGPYARMLAKRPVIVQVGDSVFVHGGILPKHADYGIERINEEARTWLEGAQGNTADTPASLAGDDAPVWTRMYSSAPGSAECATLEDALGKLGAKRMIVGHTVQKPSIAPACNEKVWRIDVGIADYYGGKPQALEIQGDAVRVLGE